MSEWNRKYRAAALRKNKQYIVYIRETLYILFEIFLMRQPLFLFHFHFFCLTISAKNLGVSRLFIRLDTKIIGLFAL